MMTKFPQNYHLRLFDIKGLPNHSSLDKKFEYTARIFCTTITAIYLLEY